MDTAAVRDVSAVCDRETRFRGARWAFTRDDGPCTGRVPIVSIEEGYVMSTVESRFSREEEEGERVRRESGRWRRTAERQTTEFSVPVRAAEISESELEPHIIRGRE